MADCGVNIASPHLTTIRGGRERLWDKYKYSLSTTSKTLTP